MKYPYLTTGLRRLLCIITVIALMTTLLAGCGKKKTNDDKDEDDTPKTSEDSMLDLEDDKDDPTEDTTPSTDPSEGSTEQTIDPELLKIRNAPSMDGTVIGKLQPGAQVDVLREEIVGDVRWGLIREGWICVEEIEKYTGPGAIIIGDGTGGSTATNPTQPTEGNNNTGNGGNGGNNGNNGNGGNNTTGTGTAAKITGIITASELNIRKDAGTAYDSVGKYYRGDRVSITETKNGWGKTDKGWISLDYVYENGKTGKNPAKGIVTGDGLNIRVGPGTNHASVGSTYNAGTRVNILEQLQIGDTWWGCTDKGWISLGYVYIDGTKGEHSGTGTVIGEGVNVRSGPGTNYESVGSKNYGDDIEIFHQVKVGDTWWGCIGSGKWICMDFVGMG